MDRIFFPAKDLSRPLVYKVYAGLVSLKQQGCLVLGNRAELFSWGPSLRADRDGVSPLVFPTESV